MAREQRLGVAAQDVGEVFGGRGPRQVQGLLDDGVQHDRAVGKPHESPEDVHVLLGQAVVDLGTDHLARNPGGGVELVEDGEVELLVRLHRGGRQGVLPADVVEGLAGQDRASTAQRSNGGSARRRAWAWAMAGISSARRRRPAGVRSARSAAK